MSLVLLASGCATQQAALPEKDVPQRYYAPRAAAALAFDPPIAADQPSLDLSRDGRSAGAFAGYEQTVTTYYYLHQRDQIRSNRNGVLERNAYTDVLSITNR